ncbi:MAG: hypothetical protein M1835_001788 [Candelina submexicana]|nr:MAG: hypothetical protein M1835_001788 [Candelina submexicana]
MVYSPQPKPPEGYYSPPTSPPMFSRTDSYGYPPNESENGPFHPDSIRSGHRSNPSIPYTGPNLPEVMGSMPPELDSDPRTPDRSPHGVPPKQPDR